MTAALDGTLHELSRLEGAGQSYDDSLATAAHDAEEAALIDLVEAISPTLFSIIAAMAYITEAAELDHYRYSKDWLLLLIANFCVALEDLSGGPDAED